MDADGHPSSEHLHVKESGRCSERHEARRKSLFMHLMILPGILVAAALITVYVRFAKKRISLTVLTCVDIARLSGAIISLMVLFATMHRGGLSVYKGKRSIVSGSILLLGAGPMVGNVINLFGYVNAYNLCDWSTIDELTGITYTIFLYLGREVLSLTLVAMQVVFLVGYRHMLMGHNKVLNVVCLVLIVGLGMLNVVEWIYMLGDEARDELQEVSEEEDEESHTTASSNIVSGIDPICQDYMALRNLLRPYTTPLAIEFSVLAYSLYFAIWERCRVAYVGDRREINRRSPKAHNTAPQTARCIKNVISFGQIFSGQGLFLGWIVLTFAVSVVLICLYDYSLDTSHISLIQLDDFVYSADMAMTLISIFALIISALAMNALDSYASLERQREYYRDRRLLFGTCLFDVLYKMCCTVAGAMQGHYVIMFDGLFGICHGVLQMVFVNWYAVYKCLAYAEQRLEKPGRQGLELLRWTNAAHWLINTFVLKNQNAKSVMDETFGEKTWAVISIVSQPMAILYYFHTLMFVSELITDIYTWEENGDEVVRENMATEEWVHENTKL